MGNLDSSLENADQTAARGMRELRTALTEVQAKCTGLRRERDKWKNRYHQVSKENAQLHDEGREMEEDNDDTLDQLEAVRELVRKRYICGCWKGDGTTALYEFRDELRALLSLSKLTGRKRYRGAPY